MAIAFRSSNVATTAGATSLTITAPTGLADNDLMVAIINVNNAPTVTAPTGWTLIRKFDNPAGVTAVITTYYKVASSESGNYTWNFSTSQRATGAIADFSGTATTGTIVDIETGINTGNVNIPPNLSVTTTVANTMLIYSGANDNGAAASWTPPTGWTEAADSADLAPSTIDYLAQAGVGSSGNVAGSCNSGTSGCVFLMAIRPPAIFIAGMPIIIKQAVNRASTY